MAKLRDLTGERFCKLLVLERGENFVLSSGRELVQWKCRCDCGKIISVLSRNLITGDTTSCGCEKSIKLKKLKTTHGKSDSKIYKTLSKMKSRCYCKKDKRYENYGGRGVVICDEWNNKDNGFNNFYDWAINNGYSEELSIDRIDVNGNYEPSNCRWVDMKTQQNNRTNNHLITYMGETKTMKQWSEDVGMNYRTLSNRILSCGWSVEDALTKPVRKRNY